MLETTDFGSGGPGGGGLADLVRPESKPAS